MSMSKSFCHMFPRSLWLWVFNTFGPLIHLELTFPSGMQEDSSFILLLVFLQFSQQYSRNYSQFPCQISPDHVYLSLLLSSLFCSFDMHVCLSASNILVYSFDYYRFVIDVENRKCDASSFVLFFQPCFSQSRYLWFHMHFMIALLPLRRILFFNISTAIILCPPPPLLF